MKSIEISNQLQSIASADDFADSSANLTLEEARVAHVLLRKNKKA